MTLSKANISSGLLGALGVWLFANYPVVALYAHNSGELMLEQIFLPIAFFTVASAIILVFWFLLYNDILKAGLATVLFFLLFWNYGLVYDGLAGIIPLQHWHLLPILLLVYGHLAWSLAKAKRRKTLWNLSMILFVPLLLLVAYNSAIIVTAEYKKHRTKSKYENIIRPGPVTAAGKNYPDIYLLVLDEFASLKTIKDEWDYDNGAFAGKLRSMGFYVTGNSWSRYNQTIWSLTSLFNLDYITGPVEQGSFLNLISDPEGISGLATDSFLSKVDFNEVMQDLNNNFLTNYLHERGYKLVILEGISQHQSSFKIRNADITIAYQDVDKTDREGYFADAFNMELLKKTMLMPVDLFVKLNRTFNVNFAGTKYIINYLKKDVQQIESPKFIYAHILCPHAPYVFDREGNPVEPFNAESQRVGGVIPAKNTVNEAYLEQYIYMCREVVNIANCHIGKKTAGDPVIIVQSDHGPRPFMVYLKNRINTYKVFNAVYFPDGNYMDLYDSIAPVNTMRVLLNKYFGEKYKMLEDK